MAKKESIEIKATMEPDSNFVNFQELQSINTQILSPIVSADLKAVGHQRYLLLPNQLTVYKQNFSFNANIELTEPDDPLLGFKGFRWTRHAVSDASGNPQYSANFSDPPGKNTVVTSLVEFVEAPLDDLGRATPRFIKSELSPQEQLYTTMIEYMEFTRTTTGIPANIEIPKGLYTHEYHRFDLPIPQSANIGSSYFMNPLYGKKTCDLVYYDEFFYPAAGNVQERFYPNIYTLGYTHFYGASDLILEALSFGSAIDPRKIVNYDSDIRRIDDVSLYMYEWSRAVATNTLTPLSDSKLQENIILTDTNIIEEINKKKFLFPGFVELEFSAKRQGHMGKLLSDTSLSHALIKHVMFKQPDSTDYIDTTIDTTSGIFTGETRKTNTTNNSYRTWDIDKFMNGLSLSSFSKLVVPTQSAFALQNQNVRPSGLVLDSIESHGEQTHKLDKKFSLFMLKKLYPKIKRNSVISYNRILNGETQYTEPLFYKIEQFLERTDNLTAKVGSTYWITAPKDKDLLQLIDTQIYPDRKYRYQVTAYFYALEETYHFDGIEDGQSVEDEKNTGEPSDLSHIGGSKTPNLNESHTETLPIIRTSVLRGKLIEIPDYYTFSNIAISEKPPMPPDVNIVPYVGVKDKILINLSTNYGQITMPAVPIFEEDKINFGKKLISQGKTGYAERGLNTLLFRGDDSASHYQILRLTEKPYNYSAFKNAELMRINAETPSFKDTLIPNKLYYYTMRTVDEHGNVSNPSPIYEVKLISNSGIIYPQIRIIVPEPSNRGLSNIKQCKRYLAIVPAFEQLEPTDNPNARTPIVGKGLFEPNKKKRFKIRLTSKSTGRRVDVNVRFEHKHNGGQQKPKPRTT